MLKGLFKSAIFMFVIVFTVTPAIGMSFYDDFDSAVLGPAWGVVGDTGLYSLTANSGSLRYYSDPMTYDSGYVNNYDTYHSTYDYNPALEIHRDISGDNWVFETKVAYHVPYTNHRGFSTNIYFGDGGAGTIRVDFRRVVDLTYNNQFGTTLREYNGSDWTNYNAIYWDIEYLSTYDDLYYERLERSGGVLTAMTSTDGTTWHQSFSVDLGSQLDSLDQRIVLAGSSWFNTGGAYADYDYVSLNAAPVPEPTTMLLLGTGLIGLAGARRRMKK